jgi:hypothetical protein
MGHVFTGQIPFVGRGPGRVPRIAHPLFLLADSQLLFWARRGELFLERARERIECQHPRAAYLGASSHDQADLFALFAGAMEGVGIRHYRLIPADPTPDDHAYLESAHLVLLGGDAGAEWRALQASGVRDVIVRRYIEGAVLVGIGAGAVQLGLAARSASADVPTLGLVPYAVATRDEADDWPILRDQVRERRGTLQGLGIPRGGGLVYHPNHRIEAIRHPVCELAWRDAAVCSSILLPE